MAGTLSVSWTIHRTDRVMRENLLAQMRLVAEAVDINCIRSLTGTAADEETPAYQQLKQQLARFKGAYSKCRFIYLTGRRPDGRVFFFVDSEPIGSKTESPAGQVYEEASPEYLRACDAHSELVEGPTSDRWGTWVSALVPLTDARTGELIAMLGMDIDGRAWRWDVALGAALPVTLMAVLLIALGAGLVAARSKVSASGKRVRRRLLIPLAAMLLLLIGAFEVAFLHMHQKSMDQSSQEKLAAASLHLTRTLDGHSHMLTVLGNIFLHDPKLPAANKSQDRDGLLATYSSVFDRLSAEHGISHLYFHRPDRVVLLRVHKPNKYGDLIDRFTLREAQRTGKTSAGIELGPLGTFTLRVVQPIRDGGEIVGYVELGEEIEDILADMQHEPGIELAVTIHKNVLTKEGWETGMGMLGRRADWDRFRDDVLAYSSLRCFPPEWDQFVSEEGHTHGAVTGEATVNGKCWHVLDIPLAEVSGRDVGDLLIFHDKSEAVAAFNHVRAITTAAALILLTILLAFLYVALERVDRSILAREQGLKASERFQRTLIETSPDLICVLDREMTIRVANRMPPGQREGDVIDRSVLSFISPEHHERLRKTFEDVLESRALRTVETNVHTSGGERCFLVRLNPLPGGDENRAVVLFATDITESKQAEEQLQKTNIMLEEQTARANDMAVRAEMASAAKSEFLANMSHEIRTPMTAILGFAEIAMESCPGECESGKTEQQDHLRTILVNGEYLLGLINNILDLSKIEAGKLVVEKIDCSPCQIAAEVESLIRVRSNAKGLELRIEYEGAIPERIQSDPTRLRQVLINLMGNAVKFTEIGSVSLIMRMVVGATGEHFLEFDVVDTGLGMTRKQASRLFQPFTQGDASTTRDFGGTGLGLAISKRLAEALGGDVRLAETKPSEGSRFRVTIATGPLDGVRMLDQPEESRRAEPKREQTAASEIQSLDCRILLAEDGPDNQRLFAHVLKKAGAEVIIVENGRLAVDSALAAARDAEPFDVILMDMQMPVMDGYEATKLLRRSGYTGPIVALTANAMTSDRQKCIDAGCNDYASKPIDRKKLIETIDACVHPAARTVPPDAARDVRPHVGVL